MIKIDSDQRLKDPYGMSNVHYLELFDFAIKILKRQG